jgi:hypothetical protein
MDDQSAVQGRLLVGQFHLTNPKERLTRRLGGQILADNGPGSGGQNVDQLARSGRGLPQGRGALHGTGVGRHFDKCRRGPLRLGMDARIQVRDGSPVPGLPEDSDRWMPHASRYVHIPEHSRYSGRRNPAPPTDRRRQPVATYLTAEIHNGGLDVVVLHPLPSAA